MIRVQIRGVTDLVTRDVPDEDYADNERGVTIRERARSLFYPWTSIFRVEREV